LNSFVMVVAILPSLLIALLFGFFNAPNNANVISKSLPMARVFVLNGVCVTLILFVFCGLIMCSKELLEATL